MRGVIISRELDIIAKEYQSKKATVLRKDLNMYQTSISTATSNFLREVEFQSKKLKQSNVILIAIIPENELDKTKNQIKIQ
jgi:hypothetical protein